jgi:DNA mismatch repair ATPase MutS
MTRGNSPVTFHKAGDFFEAYDDEAREVSGALGLTLTTRRGRPMVGIPYHAIDRRRRELQERGIPSTIQN